MTTMKLLSPLQTYKITQHFGENANSYYADNQLKGHPGTDLAGTWGATVSHSHDGLVYKILNKGNVNLNEYRAVCVLFEEDGQWFELNYGHLQEIWCEEGNTVVAGQPLGTQGNTGLVYSQGILVPEIDKLKGSTAGTHVHWQLRPVTPTTTASYPNQYLVKANGDIYFDGKYYWVTDFMNGFHGCTDAESYLISSTIEEKLSSWKKVAEFLQKLLSFKN